MSRNEGAGIMSEINPLAEPFFLTGNSGQVLLLLHGFTASPSEVRPLAELINASNGCSVSGILLPGHGSSPEHLNATRWTDWYRAVNEELSSLREQYQQVFVGGLSMGGLLALHAGVNMEGLAGVVSINAPIYYHRLLLPTYANITALIRPYYPKKNVAEIEELEAQGRFAYPVMPLKAFRSLNRLRSKVMAEVQKLQKPALIIQSRQDESVHPRSADFLYTKTRSGGSRLVLLTESNHVASMGAEKELIAREMVAFLEDRRE